MDKKISELTIVQSIDPADISILVHNNTDYQFTFATLLNYISNNISTGANISFGTTLPQNNTGKNGDVFINTASWAFAQKASGIWAITATLPFGEQEDGTLLYGLGAPNSSTGKNGDSYINTGNGTFYKKAGGVWSLVFTMLNGPAGTKGDKGDTGVTGTNGKTILNGTDNPSNADTGTNGDFYIKTSTWQLFGPKTSGGWPAGISLVDSGSSVYVTIPIGSTIPLNIPISSAYPTLGPDAKFIVQTKISDTQYDDTLDCKIRRNYHDSNLTQLTSIDFSGHSDFNDPPTTVDEIRLIIYY